MSKVNDAYESMIRNLEKNTGKALAEWVTIARSGELEKHGEIVRFLKTEHGLTHGYANMIAHKALETFTPDSTIDLVAAQYSGRKAALRPIYDILTAKVSSFGPDVELSPKKAYVSVRRSKQFAIIQPSTATRVDVGLVLKGHPVTDRLEESGSFNAMCSHRVRITSVSQMDDELILWLTQAYDRA